MENLQKKHNNIEIVNVEGQKFLFDSRIKEISMLIQSQLQDNPTEVINKVDLKEDPIRFIQKYLELHDYDLTQSKTKQYAGSSQIQDNFLDKKDVQLFEQLNIEQLSCYLQAAAYLQIESLKNLCLIALATKMYVGYDEKSLQNVRDTYNIQDLTGDDINNFKEKYKWAFNNNDNSNNVNNQEHDNI